MINKEYLFVNGWKSSIRRYSVVSIFAEGVENTTSEQSFNESSVSNIRDLVKQETFEKLSNVSRDYFKVFSGESESKIGDWESVGTERMSKHSLSEDCRMADASISERLEGTIEYKAVYITGILIGFSTSFEIELFNNYDFWVRPFSYPFRWDIIEEMLIKSIFFDSVHKRSKFVDKDFKFYSKLTSELVFSVPQLIFPFKDLSLKLISIEEIQEDVGYLKDRPFYTSDVASHLRCFGDSGTNRWIFRDHNLGISISMIFNILYVKQTEEEEFGESLDSSYVTKSYIDSLSRIVDLILHTFRARDDLQ